VQGVAKRGAQEAKAGRKVLPKEVPRRLSLSSRCVPKEVPRRLRLSSRQEARQVTSGHGRKESLAEGGKLGQHIAANQNQRCSQQMLLLCHLWRGKMEGSKKGVQGRSFHAVPGLLTITAADGRGLLLPGESLSSPRIRILLSGCLEHTSQGKCDFTTVCAPETCLCPHSPCLSLTHDVGAGQHSHAPCPLRAPLISVPIWP
jgi:hypothetical protein